MYCQCLEVISALDTKIIAAHDDVNVRIAIPLEITGVLKQQINLLSLNEHGHVRMHLKTGVIQKPVLVDSESQRCGLFSGFPSTPCS
jgi:hypothetical protein